jgi:hypothetical protein
MPPLGPRAKRPCSKDGGGPKQIYSDAAVGLKRSSEGGSGNKKHVLSALGNQKSDISNRPMRKLPKRIYTTTYPYTYGTLKES